MILIDHAHIFSPMLLTWSDRELRREALRRWRAFILIPTMVITGTVGIGVLTSCGYTSYHPGLHQMYHFTDVKNPFPALLLGFFIWKLWHFGSQNFGVAVICLAKCGRRIRYRQIVRAVCVAGTAVFMLPLLWNFRFGDAYYLPGRELLLGSFGHWFSITGMVLIFVPHWLIALWLTHRASLQKWWFLWVLAIGALGFLMKRPTPFGSMMPGLPWLMAAAAALSFTHYLYDAKLWKRGSPAMQRVLSA